MIEVGKLRAKPLCFTEQSGNNGKLQSIILIEPSFEWIVANAESLPFDDNTFDYVTISFGIRNCTDIDKVLREAHRVLKQDCRFLCLEFSYIDTPLSFLNGPLQKY